MSVIHAFVYYHCISIIPKINLLSFDIFSHVEMLLPHENTWSCLEPLLHVSVKYECVHPNKKIQNNLLFLQTPPQRQCSKERPFYFGLGLFLIMEDVSFFCSYFQDDHNYLWLHRSIFL